MKQLRKDLKSGMSKEVAYKSLIARDGNPKKGAQYLSLLPDRETFKELRRANIMLIGIWLLVVLSNLVGVLFVESGVLAQSSETSYTVLFIVLAIVLAIQLIPVFMLVTGHALGYFLLSFLIFRAILSNIENVPVDPIGSWLTVGVLVGLFAYTLKMKLKMFPFQNLVHTKKYSNGYKIFSSQSVD